MRAKTNLFKINGLPILVPDEEVGANYEDLDTSDSGRDESGVMHRIVARYKVGSWTFSYAYLTEAERQYMESLFGNEPDFEFEYPDRLDSSKTAMCRAYRAKYGINFKNTCSGLWSKYSFKIVEC